MIGLTALKQGDLVQTRGGGVLKFIAYVPEARPHARVIALDKDDIWTFWEDGRFQLDRRPCGLDIVFESNQEISMKSTKITGSENINWVGWAKDVLFIGFNKGSFYRYPGATEKDYAALVGADSVGKHFHANIRTKFAGVLASGADIKQFAPT